MDTLTQPGIPIILTVGGLIFLFAAIFGSIGSLVDLPKTRQPLAGVAGICLLLSGIGTYLLPLTTTYIGPISVDHEVIATHPSITAPDATFAVDAGKEWQFTSAFIERGTQIRIEVVEGQWTYWEGMSLYTAGEGTSYICANARPSHQCVEYLPEAPTGSLIGRIGDHIFHIGKGATITAEASGRLAFAINDAPSGLYDNDGILTVHWQTF